jgi:transcriptional regulator with XRE-family HTH domain
MVLGVDLRELREAAGLSSADAAKRIGWHASRMSKVEAGDALVRVADIEALITAYAVAPARAGQLRLLAAEARRKLPSARVPDRATKFVALESAASEIWMHFGAEVPGCLQTSAYARTVLTAMIAVSDVDVERFAADRVARGDRLSHGRLVWIVLGEEALLRKVGNDAIMRDQLARLEHVATTEGVTVQVMPLDAGAHPALGSSFTILALQGRKIAYTETLTNSDYLPREAQVRIYSLAFGRLQAAALNPAESLGMIRRRMDELE